MLTSEELERYARHIVLREVGGLTDPHAWQSLVAAQRYVENIRTALVAARPAQAAAINARAKAYSVQLAALDSRMRALMATLPPVQRRIVTSQHLDQIVHALGARFHREIGFGVLVFDQLGHVRIQRGRRQR